MRESRNHNYESHPSRNPWAFNDVFHGFNGRVIVALGCASPVTVQMVQDDPFFRRTVTETNFKRSLSAPGLSPVLLLAHEAPGA